MLKFRENEILAPYTYYKVGGPARYFFEAASCAEVTEAIDFAKSKNLQFFILGAGSNILISDKGFAGVVIRVKILDFDVGEDFMRAGAGLSVAQLVAKSVENGFGGIEWAIGIPGNVGGSIRGNAGCFGGEVKDIVRRVEVLDSQDGVIKWFSSDDCAFAYRSSVFKKNPELIVLRAEFMLPKGDKEASQKLIRDFASKRVHSQAIGDKSAGCIFKNVSWARKDIDKKVLIAKFPGLKESGTAPGISAGYCIEAAGLKGFRLGQVQISPSHANFFVNLGGATAEEVVMTIGIAKDRVKRMFGFTLEEEIQYVGF